MTVPSTGFQNGFVSAQNANFSTPGNASSTTGLQTDGQLWVGRTSLNAAGTHIDVATLTPGTGVTITNGPGSITIGLAGGGMAVEHLTGTTGGQLNPDGSNNFNLLAATAAAGTTPVTIAGSGSTLTTTIQKSQAIASADTTKIGLSNFSSANFVVDSTGFVTALQAVFAYTLVDDDATPYTVLSTDYYISCDVADAALTLKFPNAPPTNKIWIVKDLQGAAATNNISITTVGGAVTIDGVTTYKIVSNYGSVQLLFNGTSYEVF